MATFDRPQYLVEAIRSVLDQDYRDFELIISDDASPESPREVVESFRDERIRFYQQLCNVGIARNMAFLLNQAEGVYVTNLHDDDLWKPQFLRVMVGALDDEPAAVLSFCDHDVVGPEGTVDEARTVERSQREGRAHLEPGLHQPFLRQGLVDHAVFLGVGCVWRNGLVDWAEVAEVGVLWDYYTVYALGRDGGGAVYVDAKLASWRIHEGSETMLSGGIVDSAGKLRKGRSAVLCLGRMLADDRLRAVHAELRADYHHAQTTAGIALLRQGQRLEARDMLLASAMARPNARTLAALGAALAPRRLSARLGGITRRAGVSRS